MISEKQNKILLRIFFLITCCIPSGVVLTQVNPPDILFFKDRIQPLEERNIFKTPGYYNWGSSIIKGDDGQYHLFYSRWEKKYAFTGWLTHSEIAHATAPDPAGPWTYQETVLEGRRGNNWDAITAHNPKIKHFNNKYYLYYISTNLGEHAYSEEDLIETAHTGYTHPYWKILRPNQRTGVAVSNSLSGPWVRQDEPLIEPDGPITTLTVNPAICQGKDGLYYLIVKGDKPNEKRFIRNQAIATATAPDHGFKIMEKPVIDYLDTEDMSVWYDSLRDYYYGVFHAHSFIGMVSSPDGIHWKKATEYNLLSKNSLTHNLEQPDRLERPFVYIEHGDPQVLTLAVKKGDEAYTIFFPIKPKPKLPIPNKRQLAWQQAELGAVFHYDLHVFDNQKYGQGTNRITPVMDYQIFNPTRLDTDQWILSIKNAGFKFAILTATHETGFALFQSKVNPYSMKALDFQNGQGDLVKDFVNSCRKYGIKPGIYLGIRWNSFFGVHNFQVDGTEEFKINRQLYYNHMVEGMVKEICTNYGELFEIWFDGGADHPENGAPDVLPIIQQYQPNCLFYHNNQLAEARWGGSESGTVSYPCWATFPNHYSHAGNTPQEHLELLKHGDPQGRFWMPAMSDAPLRGYQGRHEWFWEPDDEKHIFPVDHLMEMYEKSVGRNSTLIVGLTPDPNGLLPEPDVTQLAEWGRLIKENYGDPLQTTAGEGHEISISIDQPYNIDRMIIQEDILKGERVREYTVEAKVNGQWKVIADGESIGHKRIQKFTPIYTKSVRLKIGKAVARPIIKTFSVFQMK